MKIKKLEWHKIPDIQETDLTIKPEDKLDLDCWASSAKAGIGGDELLKKLLSLIGDYKFKTSLFSIYEGRTHCTFAYQLLKEDGKLIEFDLTNEKPNRKLSMNVIDGNMLDIYTFFIERGEIMVIPEKTINLTTKFEQKHFNGMDGFAVPMGDKKLEVKIILNESTEEFWYLPESFKEAFRNKKFEDILDVYHFLVDNLPPEIQSYTIGLYEGVDCTDFLNINNGRIVNIKLTKEINGNKTIISQSFNKPDQDESYRELSRILNGIKRTHELGKQD